MRGKKLAMTGMLLASLTLGNATTAKPALHPSRIRDVVFEASIAELQSGLSSGQYSSRDLVRAYLARIKAYDQQGPALNAILRLNPHAMSEAAALDAERTKKGARGPLHGIPVLLKDNYDTADMPTSGGALALAGLVTPRDAALVTRLRAGGAIILGKTTMHELALGVRTISSLTGYSRNPYDPRRSPGGSSGGTGAGVAASFAAAGLGTDTCGSLRIPSAYQNLVSLRGTRGLSSRAGIMPLSDTQDIGGPIARNVQDLAVLLDATVGADPADPVTMDPAAHRAASYSAALRGANLSGVRLGLLRDVMGDAGEDQDGAQTFAAAITKLRGAGAQVVELRLPELLSLMRSSTVIPFEFREDLARYLADRPGAPVGSLGAILNGGMDNAESDGPLHDRQANPGRDAPAYRAALADQARMRALLEQALAAQGLDALIYPTTLRKPPLIRSDDQGAASNCRLSAQTGLPAIVLPAGFTRDGLPIGMEMLGPAWSEARLLWLGRAWELTAKPRMAPFSTPRLIAGEGPPALQTYAAKVSDGHGRAFRVS
jgi:Asp-tRNA(Asn)/Glu-tRNA(Gln) amidotransferase A subunit family amidase